MQTLVSDPEIVIIVTLFLLLITVAPILFVLMHQRQYHRYLSDKEEIKNLYQRELLQSQLEIQNQTFQQIGEELHDNIGQLLTVALMRLNTLEEEVATVDAQDSVHQTRDIIRTIIDDVRALTKVLDHDTVRRHGLLPSLSFELDRIQRTGRIQTQLTTHGEAYSLGEQTETVLLRMTQEALNNALKHAKASSLTVSTDFHPTTFTLSIADDGRGFHLKEATSRTLDKSGSGLNNLYRRAGLLGGTCHITTHTGTGTIVEIKLPRKQTV